MILQSMSAKLFPFSFFSQINHLAVVITLHIVVQELESQLRNCKDEFKEFERQDIKHREDLKHSKQKIKKLEDKLEKVMKIVVL